MANEIKTTVVTAGDKAFAWGVLLLVASMRRNGMTHPVVVGALDWPKEMKERLLKLGNVVIRELPPTKMCLTCQKPMLMSCDDVKTDWVCWADGDGMFVGDCSEWLIGDSDDEIVIRKYSPAPLDFNEETLKTWKNDIEKYLGHALEKHRYDTRFNAPFIVIHKKSLPFLKRWQTQINNVLPPDVEIIMSKGSAYYQTDESVLGSLLCFDPDAPKVSEKYKANGSVDKSRYFAHFAYNPKPWQMWNSYSLKWHDEIVHVVEWLLEKNIIMPNELPIPLRKSWWPACRMVAPAAPWVWRAIKLKRKIFKRCF